MLGKSGLNKRSEIFQSKIKAQIWFSNELGVNSNSKINTKNDFSGLSSENIPENTIVDANSIKSPIATVSREAAKKRAQELQKLYSRSKKNQICLSCDNTPTKKISKYNGDSSNPGFEKRSPMLSVQVEWGKSIKTVITQKGYEKWSLSNGEISPFSGSESTSVTRVRWTYRKGTSLKDAIQKSNGNFLRSMENEYASSNKRTSTIVLDLAEVYICGKRTSQDIPRAIQILCDSTLSEAKYKLIKLWIDTEHFADAFHLGKYFDCISCKWPVIKRTGLVISKKAENSSSINSKFVSSNIIRPLEGISKCWLKHRSASLINSIFDKIGESEAIKFRRLGTSKGYTMEIIPE